jgi:hypothetical protein
VTPRIPNNAQPPEIPADVETRYKAIQEEMQGLELAPEARAGESREARFAREERIKALRREFDTMARTPLARRRPKTGITVLVMLGAAMLLCALSIGGGVILANMLNQPPDFSSASNGFLNYVMKQDYESAVAYLTNGFRYVTLQDEGQTADTDYGPVTGFNIHEQVGGNSGDTSAAVQYQIFRAGKGTKATAPFSYYIIMHFTYSASTGSWLIFDFGDLFAPTKGDLAQPTPTPTPRRTATATHHS